MMHERRRDGDDEKKTSLKILYYRSKLKEEYNKSKEFSGERMVELSQELDRYILMHHREGTQEEDTP